MYRPQSVTKRGAPFNFLVARSQESHTLVRQRSNHADVEAAGLLDDRCAEAKLGRIACGAVNADLMTEAADRNICDAVPLEHHLQRNVADADAIKGGEARHPQAPILVDAKLLLVCDRALQIRVPWLTAVAGEHHEVPRLREEAVDVADNSGIVSLERVRIDHDEGTDRCRRRMRKGHGAAKGGHGVWILRLSVGPTEASQKVTRCQFYCTRTSHRAHSSCCPVAFQTLMSETTRPQNPIGKGIL